MIPEFNHSPESEVVIQITVQIYFTEKFVNEFENLLIWSKMLEGLPF